MSEADIDIIAERFRRFLGERFEGNQSALASLIGVSQPAVSRVSAGEQFPSGKLLTSLAAKSAINIHWLFSGRGEMLVTDYPDGGGPGKAELPIADQPLPGRPTEYSKLLSGGSIAVDGVAYSPSRYWLRLNRHDPITTAHGSRVQSGDMLLFDADRLQFPQPEAIDDRLCVVRVAVQDRAQIKLAVVSDISDGGDLFEADTFDLDPSSDHGAEVIVLHRPPGGKFSIVQDSVVADTPRQRAHGARTRPHHLDRPRPVIKFEDIIAVHTRLIRR